MTGSQRVGVLCSLVAALACGNTGSGGTKPSVAGAGGEAGSAAASAGSGGASAGSAGVDAAGSSGSGEAGAPTSEGGAPPDEPSHAVEVVRDKVPNKLDLLLMIDNSISMDDKQQLLADAMHHLVERLLHPRCLDEQGMPLDEAASAGGVCPLGAHPEYLPFNDIHAAVITSSLGSHGAAAVKDVCTAVDDDDHARLLGSIRPGLPSWNQTGFLAWDPRQELTPPGIAVSSELAAALAETVEAAGDTGCGYEAVLEAWYRFLIDPEPPARVVVPEGQSRAVIDGVNEELLAERNAFLRSDSVLAIVMLSDENDCSIQDEGYGWLIARSSPMYRSTAVCRDNPNDPCCQSCGEQTPNAGCPALASDPECSKGQTLTGAGEDDLNLRCYNQKARFGFDLLYPVQRYVDGLTRPEIRQRSTGAMVPNPIYMSRNGAPSRSPEQVLLLGIVGVPWQDVADSASLRSDGLRFLSEEGPLPAERWDVILGDPSASPPVLPQDPFMVESVEDRTTFLTEWQNPLVPDERLVPAGSTDPQANRINGHEAVNVGHRDLQLACSFPLAQPIVCDRARFERDEACDCYVEDAPFQRALCQPPGGGETSITQYWGSAYPGLRELAVLKGIGGHGIVASTCPKSGDLTSPVYGYRPAMDALAGRVAKQVGRSCLTRDAWATADGTTPCKIVTAAATPSCSCDAQLGLSAAPPEATELLQAELERVGYCRGASCDGVCLCELQQLSGADLTACQQDDVAPETPGFCYLNAVAGEVPAGRPELASDCVGAAPRRIRFAGGAPHTSIALLYCPQ